MGYSQPAFRKIQKTGTPRKKCFFQKIWFLGGLGFPSIILVNKPLKALCLCFKMVYQHLFYLLLLWTYWHFKITHGPTRFSMGIFGGKPRERLSMGRNSSENCVFRIEINRKCCNKQWHQFLRTAWFIRVHRNFHFLFWSLLFGLLKHQHVAPPF